jgi:CheY-like chemotaxis protein
MRAAGRVLVVDDDAAFLETVRDALREVGYAVDTAASIGGALDLLWREWQDQPDVILLDLQLPLLDGRTFAELYALLPVRHASIVLVTGVDPNAAGEYAALVGAHDVLLKPFDTDALLAAVHRAGRAGAAESETHADGDLARTTHETLKTA